MKIRTRVAVLAILPVAFALLLAMTLWLTAFRVSEASTRASVANDVIDANHELNILAMEYLLYGEARPVAQWRNRYQSLGNLLQRVPESPGEREEWRELRVDYAEIGPLFEQLTQQPSSPRVTDWRQRVASQLLIRSLDMRSLAVELVQIYEQRLFWAERQADAAVISLLVVLSSLAVAMSAVLTRGLNKSLNQLGEGVSHIAVGDLTHKIALSGTDELAELAGAFNNMTQRVQESHTSLATAEQRYRNLFENMADGYALQEIILDKSGVPCNYRFLEVNPAFERLLGVRREDVVGKTVREVMPKTEPYWIEIFGSVALTGQSARFEQYSAQFDRRFAVLAMSPQRGLFATMFSDVTERRKAEEALREREEQLTNLFNSSPAGMFVLDREFRYVRLNEPLANINGRPIAEHLGKTAQEVLPESWPRLEPLFNRVLSGETVTNVEISGKMPRDPGRVFHWIASYFPIRGREEQVVAAGGVVVDITARKRAEEELDRANAYNRSLIEASLDPLVTIGPDGKITDVNAATEAITGRSRVELIGTDFSNYFTEPRLARAGYEQAFREGYARDYAPDIRHRDGHTTPVVYNATVYRDAQGSIIGVFAAARDITARRHAEEERDRASAYNRSLIESSLDPLVTIGPDGKITDVNAATEAATGHDRTELIGADFSDYFTDPDKARAGYEQAFREGFVRDYALEIRNRNGSTTPVLYNATVYRDVAGSTIGVFAAARDVTELKHAEEELRRLGRWNRLILDSAGEGIYGLDLEGHCTFVNTAALAMLGYQEDELIGHDAHSVFHHSHPDGSPYPEDDCPMQKVHEEGVPFRGAEEVYWRKDGTAFPVEYVSMPVVEEGRVVGSVTSFLDITERKRTEEELERYRHHLETLVRARTDALERQTAQLESANVKLRELDRLKSMFIASMSHELRTPLNTIMGFTGIILQGMVGEINAEQRKQLAMVKESAGHLLALVNDVIDISKIEAGIVQPAIAPFDLTQLVNEVAQSVAVAVETKGLMLSVAAPGQLVIESDRRRVRQILINIIGNAIKFTDHGGIKVTVEAADSGVEIAIRDTGIGIAATDQEKLFTAFSQIVTEGRPKEGSGLGLYLSQKIATLLGGDIAVESELGRGSTFTVSLPKRMENTGVKERVA